MYEKWKTFLQEGKFSTGLLRPKENLNPAFWKGDILKRDIVERLIEISEDALGYIDENIDVVDIVLTGSMASYSWHRMSDIDLHVVLDFEKISQDISVVKKMLDQYRINWNKDHDIMIGKPGNEHEVEIYFQDSKESHSSLGIYSILNNQWVLKPSKQQVDIDMPAVEKKAESFAKSIDHISELFSSGDAEGAYNFASKLKNKISRLRKSGLLDSDQGSYSTENLAFKMLRNSGLLEKLSSLKISSYDKMMSLTVSERKSPKSPTASKKTTSKRKNAAAPRMIKDKQSDILEEIKDYFDNNMDSDYMKYDQHKMATIENIMDKDKPAPWD